MIQFTFDSDGFKEFNANVEIIKHLVDDTRKYINIRLYNGRDYIARVSLDLTPDQVSSLVAQMQEKACPDKGHSKSIADLEDIFDSLCEAIELGEGKSNDLYLENTDDGRFAISGRNFMSTIVDTFAEIESALFLAQELVEHCFMRTDE